MESPLVQQLLGAAPLLLVGSGVVAVISKNQSKRRFQWALAAVFLLAALKMGHECANAIPNYYSVLRVRRHADPAAFRAAFKERSLQLHPDKNPALDAQDQFNKLKTAYDVLSDKKQRDIYNFFGEQGLKGDPRLDRLQLSIDLALSYMLWLTLAIFVTAGLPTGHGRLLACGVVVLLLAIEVVVLLYDQQIPAWLPCNITEHELIWWLRGLLPSLLLLCRLLGLQLHVNPDAAVVVLSHVAQHHYKAARGLLYQLQTQLHLLRSGDKDASPSIVDAKIVELEQELAGNEKALVALHQVLKKEQQDGTSFVCWVALIAFYVAFCSLFG